MGATEDVALRAIRRMVVGLGALVLCASAASGWEPVSFERVEVELPREKTQRRVLQELLGRDRWRQLEKARFKIALRESGMTPALSELRDEQEEVADILLSSLGRIGHKSVLRALRLEERRDDLRTRIREQRHGTAEPERAHGPKLKFSPRFRFDGDAWVGAKMRLTGTDSKFWSHTSLRVGSEFDGHNPGVKFAFEDETRRAFLIYYGDHKERGESLELLIGFSF